MHAPYVLLVNVPSRKAVAAAFRRGGMATLIPTKGSVWFGSGILKTMDIFVNCSLMCTVFVPGKFINCWRNRPH